MYIVNYLFRSGNTPYPETSGDIDLSGSINVADSLREYTWEKEPTAMNTAPFMVAGGRSQAGRF